MKYSKIKYNIIILEKQDIKSFSNKKEKIAG